MKLPYSYFIKFLWLIPFLCFTAGYLATRSYVAITQLPAPCVEGKTVYEALTELSNHQLNLKLLHIKKDPDIPHGTIIRQLPIPGQMVKPRQTVFVVVSECPSAPLAPDMIGQSISLIDHKLRSLGIPYKSYLVPSAYPQHTCFAQYPAAHQPLIDNRLIIYVAQPKNTLYVLPSFVGMPVHEATDILEQYGLTPQISHPKRRATVHEPSITDQRPLAGSLIPLTPQSNPTIQLYVQ